MNKSGYFNTLRMKTIYSFSCNCVLINFRSALEAKARLYDELSSPNASKADINAAQQVLLVDFRRKQRDQEREEEDAYEDDTPTADYGDDDDW